MPFQRHTEASEAPRSQDGAEKASPVGKLYMLMIDYPSQRAREAIVNPEHTRRDIVDEVRDILEEGRNSVVFVKLIDGNFIEDVTDEIIAEAIAELRAQLLSPADLQAAAFDRARDHRKHGSV